MNNDHYLLTGDEEFPVYYFFSEGSRGSIKKAVFFQLIDVGQKLYNLAFGDWDDFTNSLDDQVRSDNRDTQKVLNTVAIAVIDFMSKNSEAKLIAKGSTESRTRLYQMNILRNLQDISKDYDVQGFKNGHWEPFKNGINYGAFLLTRRLLTL